MNSGKLWVYRMIAVGLALLLGTPLGAVASAQEAAAAQQGPTSPTAQTQSQEATRAAEPTKSAADEVASLPDSPLPTQQADSGGQQQQPAPAPSNAQQQNPPSQPMGTAAAPAEPSGGVAATRPAGAAIAPAKQKRSHTLLIRVSLLVGAAVAIGTVVGLSAASPSRP